MVADACRAVIEEVMVAVIFFALSARTFERSRQRLCLLGAQREPLPPNAAVRALVPADHAIAIGDRHPEHRAPADEVPGQRDGRVEVRGAVVVAAAGVRLGVAHADRRVPEVLEDVVADTHRVHVDDRRRRRREREED
jgi:hypothetical protein